MKTLPLFFLYLFISISVLCPAQNTYQKILEGVGHSQNFDTRGTRDGGIITTGILDDGEQQRIFVSKLDCQGIVEWTNLYHNSSTIGNTGAQILVIPNGGYLLATNIGYYQHYNFLVIRLDDQGNSIWQKTMIGGKDDVLRDVILSPDGGFVIVGATNTYGEEQNNNVLSYKDVYVTKLNSEGEPQWAKTFGNPSSIDEAYAITTTQDGGYALTGRYIDRGAFQVLLLKLDAVGDMEFIKTYGDTLSRNYAYDILQDPTGNYLISGSTTLQKSHFNDPPDAFLLKASPTGEFLWARNYIPLEADHSDSGSAVISTDNGYAISVPTLSFYTPGANVQNKFLLLQTDLDGHLQQAMTYTDGYSHYPKISKTYDQSAFILGGFSTEITATFSPHIIQLDSNFEGGCDPKNQYSNILEVDTEFIPSTPSSFTHEGSNWASNSFQPDSLSFETWILCNTIELECSTPLHLEEIEKRLPFQLFPNPATNNLSISIETFSQHPLHLQIINASGQVVEQDLLAPDKMLDLNIKHLANGLYQIRIWNEQQWGIEQFVKLSNP